MGGHLDSINQSGNAETSRSPGADDDASGIALRLDLKVRDVREATEEEIAAGTVGSPALSIMTTAPSNSHLH